MLRFARPKQNQDFTAIQPATKPLPLWNLILQVGRLSWRCVLRRAFDQAVGAAQHVHVPFGHGRARGGMRAATLCPSRGS